MAQQETSDAQQLLNIDGEWLKNEFKRFQAFEAADPSNSKSATTALSNLPLSKQGLGSLIISEDHLGSQINSKNFKNEPKTEVKARIS